MNRRALFSFLAVSPVVAATTAASAASEPSTPDLNDERQWELAKVKLCRDEEFARLKLQIHYDLRLRAMSLREREVRVREIELDYKLES